MKTLPEELLPAYERPIDLESIDKRMHAQLDFERTRVSPRGDTLDRDSRGTSLNQEKAGKLRRNLAIGTMATVGAAGTVLGIERAYDQQKTFYNHPTVPGVTGVPNPNGSPQELVKP